VYFRSALANFQGRGREDHAEPLFWALAISAFCYAGSVLPIWRMAQPVIYVGFWIHAALAMVLASPARSSLRFAKPEVAQFVIPAVQGVQPPARPAGIMPLWPMLFVTIAGRAISGWHRSSGRSARPADPERGRHAPDRGRVHVRRVPARPPGAPRRLWAPRARPVGAFATASAGSSASGLCRSSTRPPSRSPAFIVIVLVVTQLLFRVSA